MRRARHRSPEDVYYHITTRAGGYPGELPFRQARAWQKLLSLVLCYVSVYGSRLAAFEIMGNHYHLLLYMEKYRRLSRQELKQRARKLYGSRYRHKTERWEEEQWEGFNRKLFDISALMQHLNGEYAKWYNREYGRRGHLWGDRFKNPELLDREAVWEVLLYIELNAVRAGLVKRPEQWKAGSARWRLKVGDERLMPLTEIFPEENAANLQHWYRQRLYQRGAVATRPGQAAIPEEVLEEEQRWSLSTVGLYRKRVRSLTDGLGVGGRDNVARLQLRLYQQNFYRRPRSPVPQLDGLFYTVRAQRRRRLQ